MTTVFLWRIFTSAIRNETNKLKLTTMTRKFINPTTGAIVETSDKNEIKRMNACGWQKVKQTKQVFANGSKTGQRFI